MTPEDFILSRLQAWRVPRTLQNLCLSDLSPTVLHVIPDQVIASSARGEFPASFGIYGLANGGDRAHAAILRRTLAAKVNAHPVYLDDEDRPPSSRVLWVSWATLFGELVLADRFSESFKVTVQALDRMSEVKTLILTGIGDTPERPDGLDAALKGVLTRRVSEGLRTYWESPLSLDQLRARYGRTGIITEVSHV